MSAERSVRLAHAACSLVLSYPDERLIDLLPSLRPAVATLPPRFADPFAHTLSYLERTALSTVAEHYVSVFDLHRRCCLYLTYYTHGDTRGRGLALLRFRQAYRKAGLMCSVEELPDHLTVVLEFSATGYPKEAIRLLTAHRAGLELLSNALHGLRSPYGHAVDAIRSTLPPPSHKDLLAAQRLVEHGPPTEQVGVGDRP